MIRRRFVTLTVWLTLPGHPAEDLARLGCVRELARGLRALRYYLVVVSETVAV